LFSGKISPVKAFAIHQFAKLAAYMNTINPDCVFCKIVAGNSSATVLYRDEQVTAFRDLHPVAPTHILIVPNKHIESVNSFEPGDELLVGHIFSVARMLAESEGIDSSGYRIINNTGVHGGQTVFHMHFHLIGGQRMKHPMG
jgi:histidine triad (HIT) family protein